MNKIKMFFMADKLPTDELLHSLYTSVRFKSEKINNLDEEFKIWNDGRSIYIIIDEDKIENIQPFFVFHDKTHNKEIKVKHISNKTYSFPDLKAGQVISITGTICYTMKHYSENKKAIEFCPINMNGKFKEGTKKNFLRYMEKNTGLDFSSSVDSVDDVRFERIFVDEKDIYENKINKKILMRNIILVQATLLVVHPEIAQSLFYKMIGKKKTYGFGNIMVETHE